MLVSSTELIVPQPSIKVDLYVKGFSITLYTDNEDQNCLKTELITLYLDDITFFYTEKVISMINVTKSLHKMTQL